MARAVSIDIRSRTTEAGISYQQLQDLKYQLSSALLSSLDLYETIGNFFRLLNHVIPCAGLEYRRRNPDIHHLIGNNRQHSTSYGLKTKNNALGEVTFYRDHAFAEVELKALETLVSILAFPLRNALLYRQALESSLKDGLTQVGNRAALEMTLKRELRLFKRTGQPLSLLFIDIDKFKRVNDTAGHEAGDSVLITVSQTIAQALRQTDQLFRYGGEEFLVVLGDTEKCSAMAIAERVRAAIEQSRTPTDIGEVQVTVSVGVCTSRAGDTRDSLFKRGDRALYQAKGAGRNRIIAEPACALI